MSVSTYDTRFFVEHYYTADQGVQRRTNDAIRRHHTRCISAIVILEVYKLTLEKEGRETAKLRVELLAKDFGMVDVDKDMAIRAAELRHKYSIPLADSLIAATSIHLDAPCYTDDPHIQRVKEIQTRWI